MSRNKQMVIRYRLGQQIRNHMLRLQPYLRTAQIRLILVTNKLHIFRKDTLQVTTHFN